MYAISLRGSPLCGEHLAQEIGVSEGTRQRPASFARRTLTAVTHQTPPALPIFYPEGQPGKGS